MCLCGVGMTNGDQPTGNFLCQFPCAHSNPFVYGGKKLQNLWSVDCNSLVTVLTAYMC